MVSWEYPPVVIGGLGRHVHHLSTALAAAGHDVVVLSRCPSGTDPSTHPSSDEVTEGVRVIAAAQDPHEFTFGNDMMAWTLAMGHAMIRAGLRLKKLGTDRSWRPDVVHAHDWLVAHPAIALAQFYDVPMVSTIHATEAGRHSGWVSGALSRQVHAVESWLVRESDSLITCSASMNDEITELFGPGARAAGRERPARRVNAVTDHGDLGQPNCSMWGGWSTRRACTTPSPRCRGSGALTQAPH